MTLPLQPMSTAPRDGREVLIVLDAAYARWSDSNRILARWSASISEWDEGDGVSHYDSVCVGWIDLEALVRDAERLDYLEREVEIGRRILAHTDQQIDPLFLRGELITRAAIDKEMGNG